MANNPGSVVNPGVKRHSFYQRDPIPEVRLMVAAFSDINGM
jgi:hypothetical protein